MKDISCVLMFNERNEVLLQKKDSTHTWPNVWCFFGGTIKRGESPEQAIEREIKHELDYSLADYNFIKMQEYLEPEHDNKGGTAYLFSKKILAKDISKFSLHEGAGFGFFQESELNGLYMPEWSRAFLKKHYKESQ